MTGQDFGYWWWMILRYTAPRLRKAFPPRTVSLWWERIGIGDMCIKTSIRWSKRDHVRHSEAEHGRFGGFVCDRSLMPHCGGFGQVAKQAWGEQHAGRARPRCRRLHDKPRLLARYSILPQRLPGGGTTGIGHDGLDACGCGAIDRAGGYEVGLAEDGSRCLGQGKVAYVAGTSTASSLEGRR
jgi:hypothetical protein